VKGLQELFLAAAPVHLSRAVGALDPLHGVHFLLEKGFNVLLILVPDVDYRQGILQCLAVKKPISQLVATEEQD